MRTTRCFRATKPAFEGLPRKLRHVTTQILIPGSRGSPGQENGNPLQYSFLENSMDRGAWWAIVQRVAKIWMDMTKHADTFLIMGDTDISPRKFTQARKLACHCTFARYTEGHHYRASSSCPFGCLSSLGETSTLSPNWSLHLQGTASLDLSQMSWAPDWAHCLQIWTNPRKAVSLRPQKKDEHLKSTFYFIGYFTSIS